MRDEMELEKRERAERWSDGASSDAGRDHLGASGARSDSKHWAQRSPPPHQRRPGGHSELSGPPTRCWPHAEKLYASASGKLLKELKVAVLRRQKIQQFQAN